MKEQQVIENVIKEMKKVYPFASKTSDLEQLTPAL